MMYRLNSSVIIRSNLSKLVLFACIFIATLPVQAESFRQALPGYKFQFPRDLNSHDDFQIEWWYYTGNLESRNGRPFGFQLTFFRVALNGAKKINNPSRWKIDHVYFAHMAITDIAVKQFHFFERINRGGLENAGADRERFRVWNENWLLTRRDQAHLLKAHESGVGMELALTPLKGPVIHGKSGVSQKGEKRGNASHYFSYTRMKTEGKIIIDSREYKVQGTSWMDHEFSSNQLSKNQVGWDWFSLKLDNRTEIMLYRIRLKNGGIEPWSSGTLVLADGSHRHLSLDDFSVNPTGKWTSGNTQITHPSGWHVSLPIDRIDLKIQPDMEAQELYGLSSISGSYWEGSVSLTGRFKDQPVRGNGYVELVGYGKVLDIDLPD